MIIFFLFAAGCNTCHASVIFLLSIAIVNFCQWVTVHTVLAVSGVSLKCNYNLGTATSGIVVFCCEFQNCCTPYKMWSWCDIL